MEKARHPKMEKDEMEEASSLKIQNNEMENAPLEEGSQLKIR